MNAGTIIAPGATAAAGQIGTLTINNALTLTATFDLPGGYHAAGDQRQAGGQRDDHAGQCEPDRHVQRRSEQRLRSRRSRSSTTWGPAPSPGTFNGLGEGELVDILGSTVDAYITYSGGSGGTVGVDIQLNTQPIVNGTPGPDVVDLETQAAGYRYRINGGSVDERRRPDPLRLLRGRRRRSAERDPGRHQSAAGRSPTTATGMTPR